jgi:peptidoglycan/LPS O-acetylase OafA/YrhL
MPDNMAVSPSHRLQGIQLLRGVAAMLVVFHHFSIMAKAHGDAGSFLHRAHLAEFGACGVDMFFCISGFVMMVAATTELGQGRFQAVDFLIRRVLRIMPLYWIVTTILVVAVVTAPLWSAGLGPGLELPFPDPSNNPGNLLQSYLLLPAFFPGTTTVAPLVFTGWTLSYEFYFYILIAAAALLWTESRSILAALALVILALCLAARIAPFPKTALRLFLANPVVLEFVFGAAVFVLLQRLKRGAAICVALGATALAATALVHVAGAARVAFWGVPSALLLFGVAAGERRLPAPRLLLLIGDASFSLYLIHIVPVFVFVSCLRSGLLKGPHVQDLAVALACVLTVGLGVLVYVGVERPLTAALNRLYSRHARRRILGLPAGDALW